VWFLSIKAGETGDISFRVQPLKVQDHVLGVPPNRETSLQPLAKLEIVAQRVADDQGLRFQGWLAWK
jgi:hypothetical protein